MSLFREYFLLWLLSNSVAILLLVAAIKKPRLARVLFAGLFLWASWINYTTAHSTPDEYLNYAALTPFNLYRDFINGWFSANIESMVTLISIGQGLIAIGLLLHGWFVRLACYGVVIFFIAITPLGIGSAFPFTLFASTAIYFILKNDDLDFLWNNKVKYPSTPK